MSVCYTIKPQKNFNCFSFLSLLERNGAKLHLSATKLVRWFANDLSNGDRLASLAPQAGDYRVKLINYIAAENRIWISDETMDEAAGLLLLPRELVESDEFERFEDNLLREIDWLNRAINGELYEYAATDLNSNAFDTGDGYTSVSGAVQDVLASCLCDKVTFVIRFK